MRFSYPVSLDVTGRRCVVIGGGTVGEHKIKGLLDAGARVAVVAADVTDEIDALARGGQVELTRRAYARGDLDGAFLAIAATDDPEVNAAIFREAEETGVLLNAVDDIDHCHFAAPSIVRHGEFAIAVSTGGRAPALAKRLRLRLAEEYGPEYGELVDLLGRVRDETLPRRTVDFDTWADRWAHALDHDLLGLVREGRVAEAEDVVRRVISGEDGPWGLRSHLKSVRPDAGGPGKVWIVGAGPGDPGLITVKGKAAIEEADVVVCDRLVHPSLVRDKATIFVGKKAGRHLVDQPEINSLLIRLAREGSKVVRLKGGDPFVFGRGGEEAEALRDAGIAFEVIPAPTSAIAAVAAAGIPVTDRRLSSSVAVVAGHCAQGRAVDWNALATGVDTIVVLMGVAHLEDIAEALIAGGRDPATPAAIVESGTLPEQRVIVERLADLPRAARRAEIGSPAIVVVGEVVRLRRRIAEDAAEHAENQTYSIEKRLLTPAS